MNIASTRFGTRYCRRFEVETASALSFEQPLAVRRAVDLEVDPAGIDGDRVEIVVEERIVPAEAPRPAAAVERAAAVIRPPAVPRRPERITAEPARPFAAIVDSVIEAHQQAGIARRRLAIAELLHLRVDQPRILREFEPAGEGGIVGHHRESLAFGGGELALEARDVGLETGRARGERCQEQRRGRQPERAPKDWLLYSSCRLSGLFRRHKARRHIMVGC